MRNFNILFALAALISVGLLSSCEKTPATTDDPKENPCVITVSDTTLAVAAEGGDYTINLTVSNPIGDVKVGANSAADWLTVKETTTTSVVVNAAFNNDESARETILTIKYPQAEDVVITVTQAGKEGDPYTIEVKNVTYNKFTTDITVANPDNYYVLYMSEVNYFKSMGIEDKEALLTDDYNFFLQYANAYGKSLFEFMDAMGLAHKGNFSMEWTSLLPANQYVVYTYGVQFNEDGSDFTVTTPIFYEIVETPINTIGEQAFDVQVAVDGPDATISIDPAGYNGYYANIVCNEADVFYIADGANVNDEYTVLVAQEWLRRVNAYMNSYNMTAEDILESECTKGATSFNEALYANSNYAVVTFAVEVVDGIPMLSSHPVVKNFTTGDVAMSDMTFDVKLNACYSRVLDFTVTPSNDDEVYSILILNKSALEGLTTDEEILYYAVNGYWLEEYQGAYNYYNCYLYPEREYSILVFGYHGGVATTGLTRLDVKTEPEAAAENSVTGIAIHGPYDPVAIAELDSSYASLAGYAGNFVVVHWLETEKDNYAGVYHYIYDTAMIDQYGDQAIFDDLVYYSYYDVMADAGAFNTEYVIAGVVQDYRGNYSDMVYSEPFTYTTDQIRNAQEFIDLMKSDTRSGKAKVSLVGRNEIVSLPKAK